MKIGFYIIALVMLGCGSNPQSKQQYFEKKQINCDYSNSNSLHFYRVVQKNESKNDSSYSNCLYQYNFSGYSESEKLKMIEELLTYQGDTSICAISTKGYNISRSQTTPDGCDKYSIQVEALFIINHILFDDPYAYSSFPVLKKNDSSEAESIDGNLIKEAYKSYHDWLEYAKKNGFSKTLKDTIYPLKNSNSVVWY